MARPRKLPTDHGDAFQALADPTRRRLLETLNATGEHSVQDLADQFPVSFAAISQHLRILHDAGLLKRREAGRHRLYTVDPAGFEPVRAWVEGLAQFWDSAVDRLERHLDEAADDEC